MIGTWLIQDDSYYLWVLSAVNSINFYFGFIFVYFQFDSLYLIMVECLTQLKESNQMIVMEEQIHFIQIEFVVCYMLTIEHLLLTFYIIIHWFHLLLQEFL